MSTLSVKYEEPTIRAFFPPDKREKYVQLFGKSNRRPDGLKKFHHEILFDPKWSTRVEPTADIMALLTARGAPPEAYLIGTSKDQSMVPLEDAVVLLEKESGILVSIPGRLACYCGPGRQRRFILERGTSHTPL